MIFLAIFDFDDLGLACFDDDAGLESLNEDLLIDGELNLQTVFDSLVFFDHAFVGLEQLSAIN